jgi:hypothetical protein
MCLCYETFISRDQWNNTFFELKLIIEGATQKGLQFIMALKSIYNINHYFGGTKMYF